MALAGFLLVTLVAPAVVAYALRRTRAWWVAGVAVAAFGVYLLMTLDHGDHHGDDGIGAWYDLGNVMQKVYGVFVLIYAAIVFFASLAGRRAARQPPSRPPA